MRADLGPPDHARVPPHALLPAAAQALHGRHPPLRVAAPVVLVLARAHRHLRQDLRRHFLRPLVHARPDRRPEREDHVHDHPDEEEVEQELRVVGQDVREVRVRFEVAEEGGDEGRRRYVRGVPLCGSIAVVVVFRGGSVALGLGVDLFARTAPGDLDVPAVVSSFALVNPASYCVSEKPSLDFAAP